MRGQDKEGGHSHNDTSLVATLFQHEIEGKLAGELDETVVSRLGHDEDTLDVRADAGATCMRGEHRREADAPPQTRQDDH